MVAVFSSGCGRIVGFILVVALVAFGCGLIASPTIGGFFGNIGARFEMSAEQDARSWINSNMGISLPASATGLYRANLGSRATWFRFTVPQANANGVFRGSTVINCPSGVPLFDDFRPIFVQSSVLDTAQQAQVSTWWQPSSARSVVGRECTGQQFQVVRMMVDRSTAGVYTFYVEIIRP